jgi:hypothetical protein
MPQPDDRPLQSSLRPVRRDQRNASDHTHPRPKGDGPFHDSGKAEGPFGPVEYLLLALIALGVAITIAMFIVDPSG